MTLTTPTAPTERDRRNDDQPTTPEETAQAAHPLGDLARLLAAAYTSAPLFA